MVTGRFRRGSEVIWRRYKEVFKEISSRAKALHKDSRTFRGCSREFLKKVTAQRGFKTFQCISGGLGGFESRMILPEAPWNCRETPQEILITTVNLFEIF